MKRTIIALMALAGVAFGSSATLTPSNMPNDVSQTYDEGTQFGNLKLNSELKTGYINGNPGISFSGVTLDYNVVADTGKIWTDDYTVSIWLADTTSTEVLFGYSPTWKGGQKSNAIVWDATNQCITIGVGEWNAAEGTFPKSGTWDVCSSSSNLSSYLTEGLTNLTLAVSSNNGTMTADLWVNGVKIETLNPYNSQLSLNQGTSSVSYQTYSSYNNKGAIVGSIALTDEKLTTALQVATLANATLVPEPATATLSLLALAGLAARRRRK